MRTRILALAALAAAPVARAEDFPWPASHRELPNGCDLVVIPMPTPGVVATAVWMSVGSRNEIEPGRTGFAHFFEHLVFYGSEAMDGAAREAALLRLGVGDNAWTWLDETVYHATVDARSLDAFMGMQADMLANLALRPEHVRKEAGAVYGEYRKTQADPSFHLEQAIRRTAFVAHPYGHDTLGFEADIAAMPDAWEHAMAFHARWYRPEHAAVILAGDVRPDEAFSMLERHFGPWTGNGAAADVGIPVEPPQDAPRRVEVPWPTPTPPHLMLAWHVPAHRPDDPVSAALAVADALLVGPTARLRNRLVRETALAYDLSGGVERAVDPGLFTLHVELREGVDPAAVEAAVVEEVGRLARGVDAALLAATRDHVRYARLTALDAPAEVVDEVGFRLRRGANPADLGAWDRRIAAVDAAAVAEVARTWLAPDRVTAATLRGPDAP